MRKRNQVKKLEDVHQRKVSLMSQSADGCAGSSAHLKEENDARPMNRCEEKRKDWARR